MPTLSKKPASGGFFAADFIDFQLLDLATSFLDLLQELKAVFEVLENDVGDGYCLLRSDDCTWAEGTFVTTVV